MVGKVLAINISKKKGEQKHPIDVGKFIEDFGLKDDAHAGKWHRQVSLLGQESIDKMNAVSDKGLSQGDFAENITTQGIVLFELPIGTMIEIGALTLEVTQIGKECHGSGCTVMQQVGHCVMPKEGIFARVIKGGSIKAGMGITINE